MFGILARDCRSCCFSIVPRRVTFFICLAEVSNFENSMFPFEVVGGAGVVVASVAVRAEGVGSVAVEGTRSLVVAESAVAGAKGEGLVVVVAARVEGVWSVAATAGVGLVLAPRSSPGATAAAVVNGAAMAGEEEVRSMAAAAASAVGVEGEGLMATITVGVVEGV